MSAEVCRWGIMGTSGIARKNWHAILNAENATLVAVASRDVAKADAYIDENQTQYAFQERPRAIGSYEALLTADDIDAVYIPLPTGARTEWVIRAAQAGKHVLGEKPAGVSASEVEEILSTCQANQVHYMDGVMFMHSARLSKMKEVLADGESVGEIRRIASHFSFGAPEEFRQTNIRVHSELEPAGCLGDLGWYTIRISQWAMDWQMPKQVVGRIITDQQHPHGKTTVPIEFAGELIYENGVSAGFYCSFITHHQQWTHISGSKGWLHLSDFVIPNYAATAEFTVANDDLVINGCQFDMERHATQYSVREYSNNAASAHETNMFRNFSDTIRSGRADQDWGAIALQTQRIVDALMQSAAEGQAIIDIS